MDEAGPPLCSVLDIPGESAHGLACEYASAQHIARGSL